MLSFGLYLKNFYPIGVNEILETICAFLFAIFVGVAYCVYTDKGFTSDTNIEAAYHLPGVVTDRMREDNEIMAAVRVPVEWGFGMIKQTCPFITRVDLLKLQKVDVALYIRNAVLITNIRNMLIGGNQTSLHFVCPPPSMAQYFSDA